MRDAQRFGDCEGVDEEGYAAVHAVTQAMQDLESWRGLEVPADLRTSCRFYLKRCSSTH